MGHRSGHGRHSHHQQQHDNDGQQHGQDQQYVTGGTNWETYELPELVSMVRTDVDIPALEALADDWREAGDEMVAASRDLGRALDDLMNFWSGEAAEQARTDVALNAQWVADLGSTAHAIGTPIEQSAGALKAAQAQMPDIPAVAPAVTPGSAPHGALAGRQAAGPLGEAIGGVAEGSESAAQAAEAEARLKRQAVETMQRFEAAAMSIDQAIPQFEGRSTVLRPDPPEHRTQPPVTTIIKIDTDTTVSWQELTGQRTGAGTSAQNFADHGSTGGGSGGGDGGGHAAMPVGGGFGGGLGAPGSGGGRSAGSGSGAGALAPPGERVPGGLAASAAMPDGPDGQHGMTGAGAPMGGMGAGAGGSSAGDHRRRFPFEADDPFTLDQKASPPVIGL
jgi:hypothetical protein